MTPNTSKSPKAKPDGAAKALKALADDIAQIIWPHQLEKKLSIDRVTRWRWERDGKLPKRDAFVGGRSGWRPATIADALKSSA